MQKKIENNDLLIILLPGMDGTGELFRWFRECLGDNFKAEMVIYPEDTEQDYDNLAIWVMSIIGSRRVLLLGESFSGPIAIKTAALIPKQIEGLILVSTFVRPVFPKFLIRFASKFELSKIPMLLRKFFLFGISPKLEVAEKFESVITKCEDKTMKKRIAAVANCDVGSVFQNLQIPILCLHGTRDLIVRKPLSHSNATIKMVDAPHMLLQTQPLIASEIVKEFISTIS